MDKDLRSIQQARALLERARSAQRTFAEFSQEAVDAIVAQMARAGEKAAEVLAVAACEETGFGRVESKVEKNLFATRALTERMRNMKTCGVINRIEDNTIWEIGTPMGIVAALVPSTNPTSTAMYKAIIAAKARCALVISPHPRAAACTAKALDIVAEAAYRAGAPEGLFGCMTEITIDGTNALLEDPRTDLILATGGSAMVKAAYSKGKPAYGVGSGNVPAYVDRSADLHKAARDLVYGASFDYGTLCSTERSVVADVPIRGKLLERLREAGSCVLDDRETDLLRRYVWKNGKLNINQVGKSPVEIAMGAGFSVPPGTSVLVAEVKRVGHDEPLSMETLSPILSFYTVDGWEAGCERCKEILAFGGIGHTLGLHCGNERIIEAFALEKPAMRIVVNTVCALGAVGYTNRLFPAMTLGPGTIGGSITSDNISPLHLLNIKRLAFETNPVNPGAGRKPPSRKSGPASPAVRNGSRTPDSGPWMREVEERLRARAGNPASERPAAESAHTAAPVGVENPDMSSPASSSASSSAETESEHPMSDERIHALIARFRHR